jgi:hypothetical protein
MDDADKFTTSRNGTGPGYSAYAPVALVARLSDSERSALESDGRRGHASAAEPDTEIQYRTSIQHSPSTFLIIT